MAEIKNTRLRYLRAKNIDDLISAINNLAFKIEIKGNPVFDKKGWVIFFVIPDTVQKFNSMEV